MTTWSKSVSWSKFKMALDCPLQVQYLIEKKRGAPRVSSYHQMLGKLVQKAYELYFEHRMNLMPKGQDPEIPVRLVERVVQSGWMEKEREPLVLPDGVTKAQLVDEAKVLARSGFVGVKQSGMLDHRVRSELQVATTWQGFRMFGMHDFVVEKDGYFLFDGKGNRETDAEPMQLLYYGLQLHSTGKPVRGGGFIYWRHGYQPVDLSPAKLKEFVEGPFQKGRKVFDLLRVGVEKLEATPSAKACFRCSYRNTCDESVYRRAPPTDYEAKDVGL